MKYSTPEARRSLRKLHRVADRLRGRPMLPLYGEAVEFSGPTPWHVDTGTDLATLKLVLYLHDSTDTGGWLRFSPGSHDPDRSERLAARLRGSAIEDRASTLSSLVEVEGAEVAGSLGDVVAIDGRVWHGSPLVCPRSQFAVTFVPVPTTSERSRVQAFIETCYSPGSRHPFDPDRYPYYSKWWLLTNPTLAMRLRRLGALASARKAATA